MNYPIELKEFELNVQNTKSLIDIDALREWMDSQSLGKGALLDVANLAGGTQNILVRFRREDTHYVLRRPPVHLRAGSNETMRREARVLAGLAQTDVPHARLIAACGQEDVLGVSFYLMEPVEGFNPTTGLPDYHAASETVRRRMGFALVEGIAALGALDYRELGLEGFGRPDNYLERQVSRWRAQLDGYEKFSEWPGASALGDVDKVAQWLENNRPASFKPGILHGDYHLANVMYCPDSAELAAIVDWELSTIGDPLLDLGWLMATWPDEARIASGQAAVTPWQGFPTCDELVAHYAARTERDMTHIEWYGVLACYKLGILLEGTYARACAGRAPKAIGDTLHTKAVGLFARAAGWIQ